jgi:transmembrane sensor
MNRETGYYQGLMKRYIDNNCTPQEANELLDFLQQSSSNRMLLEEMSRLYNTETGNFNTIAQAEWSERIRNELLHHIQTEAKLVPFYRRWLPQVAAAVVLLIGATIFFQYLSKSSVESNPIVVKPTTTVSPTEVLPGTDKALLTLADGTVVVLDSAKTGSIAAQGGTVLKNKNGLLVYDASGIVASTAEITFNTISTPKGGQYQVLLPDGSKAWLNAASSLRFPTVFTGATRTVELTGEGYFEIAKNEKMPFHVKAKDVDIEVVGTHFNVMSYANEAAIRTTLLEGSVKLNHGNSSSFLKPGQQGDINPVAGGIKVAAGNVDEAVAWKNGNFYFDNAGLTTIMRQFERWYNIEVTYEGVAKQRYFNVEMSRNMSLSQVLKLLNAADIQFKIDQNKLSVIY